MLADFPAEDDCVRALWVARFGSEPPNAACPRCGRSRRFYPVQGRRAYACETCRHHVYLTAASPLQRARLPLRAWFTTVVLVRHQGDPASARDIHRHTGGSYKAVRRMRSVVLEALMGTVAHGEDAAASLPDRHGGEGGAPYSRRDFDADLRRLLGRP